MLQNMPRPRTPAEPASRGISTTDVDRAADALLRAGERPTIEKVRLRIGRGSPNTITPLLDDWWSCLASRIDAGPAALHRLPEPVAHAAEGLWLTAVAEARRRAQAESRSKRAELDRDRQDLAVQSHVLGLRESELNARLEAADRRIAMLETELTSLTTLLRKEQASRLALEARTADPPRPRRRRAPTKPTAAKRGRPGPTKRSGSRTTPTPAHARTRRAKPRKPVKIIDRRRSTRRRNLPSSRRPRR